MRIQKLELFGFKSFPDRTTFEFGSGISCVVGPNGSGKSNVVDALRWVIGEQSARSLRGKDMTDVIFAGSAARNPVGFAEVALTLFSDGGEPFPGDLSRFESVEVGRRLFRDGSSEYLLNKVKCRRRDIVDLFLDTGVGANLYSFIAQGQVDRIVSQSAHERRSLIDEAAGISRYKARRDEAITRLTATGLQLDRASDVAEEMGRRLRTLERQVLAAGRFRRLRARIRQREVSLGVLKYAALSGDRRALRDRSRKLGQTTGALRRSVERLGGQVSSRQEEVDTVAAAVSTWRDQAAELEARRREAEGARDLHRTRHAELTAQSVRAADRATRASEEAAAVEASAETAREALSQLEVALASESETSAVAELRARDAEMNTAAARVSALSEQNARQEAARGALTSELERLAGVESAAPWEAADLSAERLAVAELEASREAVRLEEESATRALKAARDVLSAQRAQLDRARKEHRQAIDAWEAGRRRVESEVNRRRSGIRRALADLERQAREFENTQRKDRERRASTWLDALTVAQRLEVTAMQARARAAEQALQAEAHTWLEAHRAADAEALEASRARIDREPVERAAQALAVAEAARTEARAAAAAARTSAHRAEGRAAAMAAEWEALELARTERIPDAWKGRSSLGDVLDAADPRRLARPGIVELPVLTTADLDAESGEGVIIGPSSWTVVDDRTGLLEAVERGERGVVTEDGRIRVDRDGVVSIGAPSSNRWAELGELVEPARQEAERASEAAVSAELALRTAEEAHEQAAARLADARVALQDALQEAESSVRRARSQARERHRIDAEHALEQVREHGRVRLAALEAECGSRLEAAHSQRTAAFEAPVAAAVDGSPAVWAAWCADWPLHTVARPELEESDVDDSALRAAESTSTECRDRADAVDRALVVARRSLAEAERAEATRRAQWEAADRSAAEAQGRREAIGRQLDALTPVEGREEANESLVDARAKRAEAAAAVEAVRSRSSELRERRAALTTRLEGLADAATRLQETIASGRREAKEQAESAAEALTSSEASEAQAVAHATERADVLARLERDRKRHAELSGTLKRVRGELGKAHRELQTSETEEASLTGLVERLQEQIETLRGRLGERYQVSLPGLLDRLHARRELVFDPDPDVARELVVGAVTLEAVEPLSIGLSLLDDEEMVVRLVGEVEELRIALQKVGDVNLAAEEEYVDLRDRATELETQRQDLEDSVTSIRTAIAKMNRTCRERFRDAYDRVNEAFQISYPKLVGGGDARLALTNDEDLLETGVDIFVRPPGKRLQNLTLLSGGEKAMTAIALLLALFKVRPSPFCVLDEVDAPLDEANGSRFNEMVREMSHHSQFIVITHNRKTMECADVLYGVTMAKPGVSTLVSVALEA